MNMSNVQGRIGIDLSASTGPPLLVKESRKAIREGSIDTDSNVDIRFGEYHRELDQLSRRRALRNFRRRWRWGGSGRRNWGDWLLGSSLGKSGLGSTTVGDTPCGGFGRSDSSVVSRFAWPRQLAFLLVLEFVAFATPNYCCVDRRNRPRPRL